MDDKHFSAKPIEIPEEAIKQILENEEDSFGERLLKSVKRSPFFVAGVAGLGTVCGIGYYKWKTRTIPAQLFLIQLRVAAQSTALGFITLGMVYQLYTDYVSKQKPT